jgi:hypothetical protein
MTDQTVLNVRASGRRSTRPIPTILSGVTYPTRTAAAVALARLVPCSIGAASQMLRRCGGDIALQRLRKLGATREKAARVAAIARAHGVSSGHLNEFARRDGLSLTEWAEWARTHCYGITVAGKVYRNKTAYFAALSRRHGVSVGTLKLWMSAGTSLEDLAGKALARESQPDRFHRLRHGEVSAYGWRWASTHAFSIYYFGYAGARARALRMMTQANSLSLGMAALEYILHLFDIGELGADCRWPPEREATMPTSCLPLNAREDRLPDELYPRPARRRAGEADPDICWTPRAPDPRARHPLIRRAG